MTKDKLIEILKQANSLNDNWIPDFDDLNQPKWSIEYDSNFIDQIEVFKHHTLKEQLFNFQSRNKATKLLELFNKNEIKEILELNQITLLQLLEEK